MRGAAVIALVLTAASANANLLYNGDFEITGPAGSPVTYSGVFAGPSAADGWEVFHNTSAATRTELIPSTLPGGSGNMIHVFTTGAACGLDQVFLPFNTGPDGAQFSVWLYVISGTVGVGVGNGGNTSVSEFSTLHEVWQHVTGTAANDPGNNMIIYSVGGGANFYAEMAEVVPAPGAGTAVLAGIGGLLARRRR